MSIISNIYIYMISWFRCRISGYHWLLTSLDPPMQHLRSNPLGYNKHAVTCIHMKI